LRAFLVGAEALPAFFFILMEHLEYETFWVSALSRSVHFSDFPPICLSHFAGSVATD